MIRGLHRCVEYCRGEVEHFTDSKLVAKQASGEWVVTAPNLKPLAQEVSREKLQFERVTHKYLARSDPKIHRIDGIVNEKISSSL